MRRLVLVSCLLPVLGAEALPGLEPLFEDRTTETELHFVHTNGMTGSLFYPEVMGPGAALLDYDGDGDLNAYLM